MVDLGHRFGLRLEAGPELRVSAKLFGEDLNGDGAIKRFLLGAVDCPHSPLRDEVTQFVSREKLAEFFDLGGVEGGGGSRRIHKKWG